MPNIVNLALIFCILYTAYHIARNCYFDARLARALGKPVDKQDIQATLIVLAVELLIAYQLLMLFLLNR